MIGGRFFNHLTAKLILAGLAQFAGAAATVALLLWALGSPAELLGRRIGRYYAESLDAARSTPGALERELDKMHRLFGADATIYNADGTVVANTVTANSGMIRAQFPLDSGGWALIARKPQPGKYDPLWVAIVAILVVVAIVSYLLSRSFIRPIAKMRSAAQFFGAGDLTARTGIRRRDEIGQLAASFDEMADRIGGLIRSEKELLAAVSHELRTPLARIRVALDLAEDGDPEEARSSLLEIGSDLAELERIINDVLTTARLELIQDRAGEGTFVLRHEDLDMNEFVTQAAARHGATLEIGPGLPSIKADPVVLRRALDNLLANALRHGESSAPPMLAAWRADGALFVEVRDRGVGIAAEELKTLMEPFRRTDRSRSRATGGLGLGLSLARRIVEAHGGTLSLLSEPGRGTTARIALPI